MMNNERFRTEFAANLDLPPELIQDVLKAFDMTSADYNIERKPLDIIPFDRSNEFVKAYIASKYIENRSIKTLAQYRYKLTDFFNVVRKPVDLVEPNDIRLYLYGIKQERNTSDRYLDCIRITLNGFFKWLHKNKHISENPCDLIDPIKYTPKEREPLTPYELEVLRWSCENVREKALVDFLFSTGCRVSECADVKISDIDFHARSVVIRHGKGNKQRTVYFNAESELTLRKYLATRKDDVDALFVSTKKPHQPIKAHAIENIIAKVSERAGMHVFPHKLRHTFATSGLRGGMPLEKLQMLMGHEKPETTMIYAKLDRSDLKHEHQRIYA